MPVKIDKNPGKFLVKLLPIAIFALPLACARIASSSAIDISKHDGSVVQLANGKASGTFGRPKLLENYSFSSSRG